MHPLRSYSASRILKSRLNDAFRSAKRRKARNKKPFRGAKRDDGPPSSVSSNAAFLAPIPNATTQRGGCTLRRSRIDTGATVLQPRDATSDDHTTAVVQRYLDDLAGDSPAEPIVRALLDRSVRRLHLLCASLLYGSYPRLTQPPLSVEADELLGAITERLLKALREVRPRTVRPLFALANQHMRWERNDLARRLDNQPAVVELRAARVIAGQQRLGAHPGRPPHAPGDRRTTRGCA
jgi:hypothetical protein